MRSLHCMDFLICSVMVIAIVGYSKAELEQTKNRRAGGGSSGLFGFPRVGRSDPTFSGNNFHNPDAIADNTAAAAVLDALYPSSSSIEDYEEYFKSDDKRAGLIVSPRVGRSDADMRKWARIFALQQALDKRAGPTTGVWFGPRLGKRNLDNKEFEKYLQHNKEY